MEQVADENMLASDILSVGSCDSLVRDELDFGLQELEFDRLYCKTQAGISLENALNEMLANELISVEQRMQLLWEFNKIYRDSFDLCHSRLHLDIHASLSEYSTVEAGSLFELKVCACAWKPLSSIELYD
jgi:hypothetical protein